MNDVKFIFEYSVRKRYCAEYQININLAKLILGIDKQIALKTAFEKCELQRFLYDQNIMSAKLSYIDYRIDRFTQISWSTKSNINRKADEYYTS